MDPDCLEMPWVETFRIRTVPHEPVLLKGIQSRSHEPPLLLGIQLKLLGCRVEEIHQEKWCGFRGKVCRCWIDHWILDLSRNWMRSI